MRADEEGYSEAAGEEKGGVSGTWAWGRSPRRKKKAVGRGDQEGRLGAYFCAQWSSICQLLGDGELGWGTIGECFFIFFKKNKDEEERLGTVGDALTQVSRL